TIMVADKESDKTKYNVAKLLAQMGVEPSGVKAVELVSGDDVVARADGEKFNKIAADFYFTLPKHLHGKVRVHVPTALQSKESNSGDKDALISSVQIYKTTKPA